jgi:hypothetical protein
MAKRSSCVQVVIVGVVALRHLDMDLGLPPADPLNVVKIGIKREGLLEPEPLHEYDVVAVGKAEVPPEVESKDAAIVPLARKDNTWQLNEGKQCSRDSFAGFFIGALEGEDRLEDDGVGGSHLEVPLFDAGENARCLGGENWVVFAEVTQEDVGVEEGKRH